MTAVTGDELLTPREVGLVAAIVANPEATQEELGAELRITARYVRKLLARERVRRALDAAARAGLADASSRLGRGAARAADSLLSMATGKIRVSGAARVSAAKAVIDGASKLVDLIDLEKRIAQLEQVRGGGWSRGGVQ